MFKYKNKNNINTLLNIDNVFGDYESHVMPIVLTIAFIAFPLLLWLFALQGTPIRLWMVAVFDVFWGLRWALIFVGKEKDKLRFYEQQRKDVYQTINELVHISVIHEDGLIEYDNGVVAYIIVGNLNKYLNDDKLSVSMENFMNALDRWHWDFFIHNSVEMYRCEDELPKLHAYTDDEVIKERMGFYSYQDKWVKQNSRLYTITFLVTSSKSNWKKMRDHLNALVNSEVATVFNSVEVAKFDEVNAIVNRDICGYIDINKMLLDKYSNTNYNNSKVLWYDDEIPQKYVQKDEVDTIEDRRLE